MEAILTIDEPEIACMLVTILKRTSISVESPTEVSMVKVFKIN